MRTAVIVFAALFLAGCSDPVRNKIRAPAEEQGAMDWNEANPPKPEEPIPENQPLPGEEHLKVYHRQIKSVAVVRTDRDRIEVVEFTYEGNKYLVFSGRAGIHVERIPLTVEGDE